MKVLVLGASGMLGNAMMTVLSSDPALDVWGTLRQGSARQFFSKELAERLVSGVDVLDPDALNAVICKVNPDVVINCIGLIKQLAVAKDPLSTLPINSMLPHRLARLCELSGARLVLVSTDCVFSGRKGAYVESDMSDADDLYGKSKYIGEVHDQPHVVTLRSSIIGHEISTHFALVDWFLSQRGRVKGFQKAIYSGFPTVVLADIIKRYVLPNPNLNGLYHVASNPISKFELLGIVNEVYGRDVEITPDDAVVIDRSLNGTKFSHETGFVSPSWKELIETMHSDWLEHHHQSGQ